MQEIGSPKTGPLLKALGRRGRNLGDVLFESITGVVAGGVLLILGLLILLLIIVSWPSIYQFGFRFITSSTWDPVGQNFGALPFVFGTVVTSIIALLLAAPAALAAALFLSEYAPPWLREPVSFLVEMLAAIPSIIYGLWGFFVLSKVMRFQVEPFLKNMLGWIPGVGSLFGGMPIGRDLLIGGVILAIMIFPTVMSISREVFRAVPNTQREGLLALGATRFEVVRMAVLPYARAGTAGAAVLGLARALGETMAVTMVIGNSSTRISPSLFTPGYTLASAIANQFNEADKPLYFSAIVELALVLMAVSMVLNIAARLLVRAVGRGPIGLRA